MTHSSNSNADSFKVLLVGPSGSGKSELLKRLKSAEVKKPKFQSPKNMVNISMDIGKKEIELKVWDPVYDPTYVSFGTTDYYKQYFFGTDLFVILLRDDEVSYLHRLEKIVMQIGQTQPSVQLLVINKMNVDDDSAAVTMEMALSFAKHHKCQNNVNQISAKTGMGVNQLILDIAKLLTKNQSPN